MCRVARLTTPACCLPGRFCHAGLKVDEGEEDLTVTFPDAMARVTALELCMLLRLLSAAQRGHEGLAIAPLHPQTWELPQGSGPRRCARHRTAQAGRADVGVRCFVPG